MEITPYTSKALQPAINVIAGQLMPSSAEKYAREIALFQAWLLECGTSADEANRETLARYHQYLQAHYAPATAKRKWSFACRLFGEAYHQHLIAVDPSEHMRGFSVNADYSPHVALTREQFRTMLGAINRNTLLGKRDYALLLMLGKTGLRRAEIGETNRMINGALVTVKRAALVADLGAERWHTFLTITGKGGYQDRVKLRPDVKYVLDEYLQARCLDSEDAPLFAARDGSALHVNTIWQIVMKRSRILGLKKSLSPHDLRATFATLALEKAPLHKVQAAMRHKDPRTTQRYNKRKDDLDDNAVDVDSLDF